ncbi:MULTISPECIES: YafY family protein [unclassified Bosea (in: a-proteobacteria)]|uniref:helix-turn-helix transcriptional regulator n=1 Tax=unclassified Bosea (in: a-proteobacteria) TaxID=2653178 RepID=UPI000955FE24|nr:MULTISPECIES: YafY family protein [unclassified Bosea (in: a-proteobacteria)]TAJ29271.1 MAG: YafY family transcriptional regulator [Bosea sp. (in: a-proteobacteria)]SIP91027.1 Predicted DNA-binding transcriptional regulator YafY, contains an HTH and WYL domains [Bosea sp. TND4EK4]
MQRAERLLDMIQSLRRRRRPVTAETLAAELNVSVRTVYRDIGALVRQGVPVRGEAGIGYVLDAGFDLPPLMLSPDEIEAVLVGMRWLTERADPSLARAAEDVVSKVAAVLPSHLKPILLDGALFAASYPGDLPVDRVDIAPVRAAIRNGRKLSIHYSDESGQATQRMIWPIGMTFYERVRVVIAWCELRQAFRHFRTDRITGLAALEERYPGRRAELFRRWQKEEETAREEWARCQREGRGGEAAAADKAA